VSDAVSSTESCSCVEFAPDASPFLGVDLNVLFKSTVVFLCLFTCVGVSKASSSLLPTVFFAELAGVAAMPGVSVPRRVVTIVTVSVGGASLVGASSLVSLGLPWYEGVRLRALLATPKSCANIIFWADPEKILVAPLQESGPGRRSQDLALASLVSRQASPCSFHLDWHDINPESMSSSRLLARSVSSIARSDVCAFCHTRQQLLIGRNNILQQPTRAVQPNVFRRTYAQKLDVKRLRTDVDKRARVGWYTLLRQSGPVLPAADKAEAIYNDFVAHKDKKDYWKLIKQFTTSPSCYAMPKDHH
jgi:hypothetical protein